MQEWRRQALGQVPLLKRYFRHAYDPMAVWIELQARHWRLCHDEDRFRLYDGEPIPDISVVTGGQLDYLRHHPTPDDVRLLVEVAVSSVASDTGDKALLYAKAGIGDYWVVLPEQSQIVVHRSPSSDGYGAVVSLRVEDVLSPQAAPDVTLAMRDLLGLPPAGEGAP